MKQAQGLIQRRDRILYKGEKGGIGSCKDETGTGFHTKVRRELVQDLESHEKVTMDLMRS